MSRSSGGRRRSLSALEVLSRQVREDGGLDAFPEVRRNLLTRIRGLQRTGPDQDEQDLDVVAVLIRRDVLVGSGAVTPEAIGLRVRQSEQLLKLQSARRRGGRRVPPRTSALWRKTVPTAGSRYKLDDEQEAYVSPADVEGDAPLGAGEANGK